jgi:hypothetical protein
MPMRNYRLSIYVTHTGCRQQLKLTASKSGSALLAYAEALPAAQRTPDTWRALECMAAVVSILSAAMPAAAEIPV